MKKLLSCILALTTALVLMAPVALADTAVSMDGSRSISLGPTDSSKGITLDATMTGFEDAAGDKLDWESSNVAVCTVSPATTDGTGTGIHSVTVTGTNPGSATISAKDKATGNVLATCKITVKKTIELAAVSTPSGSLNVNTGTDTAKMKVTPASDYSSYYYIDWSSDNTSVAMVSGSGLDANIAAGSKVGTATITAKIVPKSGYGEFIAGNQVSFTVNTQSTEPYIQLSKSPSGEITAYGYPGTVQLTLKNDSGYTGDGTITWQVSDKNVLTFNGPAAISGSTATANFTTKSNGTCKITATMVNGDGKKLTDSVTVVVNKKLPYITLEGGSYMNANNRNLTLVARLYDNDTYTYVGNESVQWRSGDGKLVAITAYDSHLSGYVAQVTVRGRYNTDSKGVRIYVNMAKDPSISAYHTVYVSGLSYLPQTGQDTRTLYIVGALCVVMFAAAGVFFTRRKKNAND